MKKNYETPTAEKIEFHYSNQVIASGGAGGGCYWQNNGYWSHATQGCQGQYHQGTGTQVPA